MSEQVTPKLPPLKSETWRERRGRGGVVWTAALAAGLLIACGAAVFYGLPTLRKHGSILQRIPGMEQAVEAAGKRLDAFDERLKAWDLDRQSMNDRLSGMETRLQSVRKQAQQIAAETERRVQAQFSGRLDGMQARLIALETSQQSDRARIARLQEELAAVRGEADRQVAALRDDTGRDIAGLTQKLADAETRAGRDRRDLRTVAGKVDRMDRQRLDFEVSRGKSEEVAPGVSLHVSDADPRYRRVNGWIFLMPDRRTLWLRGHGVQQPVRFYQRHEDRPVELVVTQVARNSVAGYVLMPVSSTPAGPGAEGGQ
jgi:hypothetical protein